ncbi:MAG: bifunctional methylenetetrahydrofolate dehydrogenase/methenyltetrahydrofolate cyclohydrolase FolD [Syntrophales bacterium]|jgi:methylenetetrahydrofolate dehydrogenase (NADP+)/methenyltetrahydrofolate cyclohydrolase|nr:bifunctional methylenetetrahydrofolate dehydrogenase/methenyltetrahydrofolate cyclohydrolase FolD [Syntrophales bacterium]MDY0043997.1 bifunctional methylenetetrahydrofolate dehydrogenase/methenyltetrahydrofolate cyclohydrolase FolD [Syntrophales bacterium]
MAVLIDGKEVSRKVRNEVKDRALLLKRQRDIIPGLAVVLVGEDPASQIYVRGKKRACDEVGFLSREFLLPSATSEEDLLSLIKDLNEDRSIHGILVQLPLPEHLNGESILEAIDPRKDVDGFHPYNVGKLFSGTSYHRSCTPLGIIELLDRYRISIEGKEAVIVGRSNIVGKPLALMLLERHATVTICHTRTRNLAETTRRADILVAAAGRREMIRGDMIKEGAAVIDVGINRSETGKLFGDVLFTEAEPKASFITPVPGGVGPMTIAMLLFNTLNAASRSL